MIKCKIDKYDVFISETVLSTIESFKQSKSFQNEGGGILLGQVKDFEIYILKCSIPNNFDKANRYIFERDSKIAQILVEYEFANSNHKTIYLGEWHTHPENIPSPSSQDKKMLKEQLKFNDTNEPFVILLIQGVKQINLSFYNGNNISQLKLINYF